MYTLAYNVQTLVDFSIKVTATKHSNRTQLRITNGWLWTLDVLLPRQMTTNDSCSFKRRWCWQTGVFVFQNRRCFVHSHISFLPPPPLPISPFQVLLSLHYFSWSASFFRQFIYRQWRIYMLDGACYYLFEEPMRNRTMLRKECKMQLKGGNPRGYTRVTGVTSHPLLFPSIHLQTMSGYTASQWKVWPPSNFSN